MVDVCIYAAVGALTHWGRVTHICVVELGHHWFRQWLVACSAPSHYLNQCWNIVNWTFRNKLQWIFYRNSNIFIQEIAFENVVCNVASILSRPQWVKASGMLTVERHSIHRHDCCQFRSSRATLLSSAKRQNYLTKEACQHKLHYSDVTWGSTACSTACSANNKENISALHYWLLSVGIHRLPSVGFPPQRASNGERISMRCMTITRIWHIIFRSRANFWVRL